MPVARSDPRQALGAAAVVVVGAGLLVGLTLWISSRGGGAGDGRFDTLQVQTLLDRQERDGVPSCFDDPVDGLRPICVFHTGDDPEEGWVAYDAQVDGCALEYRDRTDHLDPCTGRTFPFTGEGLAQYDTEVVDDRLVVDFVGDEEREATSTTTTVVESGEVPE